MKENLIDRERVGDRIEEIFEIICLYKNDPKLTIEQYVDIIQKFEDEIRLIIKQTLQKELKKIEKDIMKVYEVLGDKTRTYHIANVFKKYHK